jgi:hypothetical protein
MKKLKVVGKVVDGKFQKKVDWVWTDLSAKEADKAMGQAALKLSETIELLKKANSYVRHSNSSQDEKTALQGQVSLLENRASIIDDWIMTISRGI